MTNDLVDNRRASERHPAAVGALVTTISGAGSWCLTRVASEGWPKGSSSGPASVDEILVAALAWAGALLTGWLAVTSLVAVMAAAPGVAGAVCERLARLLTPHVARQVLSLALGASLGAVALPAPPAVATGTADASRRDDVAAPAPGYSASTHAVTTVAQGDDGGSTPAAPRPGWLPNRPPPAVRHDARLLAPAPRPTSATSDTLTVRRGDTLWSIAAAHLGPGATDAEIAAEWPRWYEANRAVIGDDPDIIVAGQQLQAPLAEVFR